MAIYDDVLLEKVKAIDSIEDVIEFLEKYVKELEGDAIATRLENYAHLVRWREFLNKVKNHQNKLNRSK